MRKSKVLLIEDEKLDALAIGRVLKQLYPEVLLEILQTGEQALDWISRFRQDGEKICLIVMDMTLPRMEGLELISEIKANPDLAYAPIVVLSGNDSPTAIRHAYKSGSVRLRRKEIPAGRHAASVDQHVQLLARRQRAARFVIRRRDCFPKDEY
ncbi:MAG: response regulator [Acidobacteria bacterium]|nr:response regulator [Acidobacteriota bacterium]MBV9144894.1 response regulator [Acidobacteriota bacterium]